MILMLAQSTVGAPMLPETTSQSHHPLCMTENGRKISGGQIDEVQSIHVCQASVHTES